MMKTVLQDPHLQQHSKFLLKPLTVAISLLFFGAAPTAVRADAGITDLGTRATNKNDGNSSAYGVNAAGDVVVGSATASNGPMSNPHAFRWTQADGMVNLGTLSADKTQPSYAYGVSATGDVVVGETTINSGYRHAFRWTQATGMIDLGTLDGAVTYGTSTAYGVNATGTVVVGTATHGIYSDRAFRWTEATGMIDLGTLGGNFATAYGVNRRWRCGGRRGRFG